MAITANATGSWVAANATTQTVTLPTHAAGDMLLVRVGFKHATMPTTVTCGTAGWAKVGEKNSGTASSSNGGGDVQCAVFWKIATSGAETDPVITFNGGAVAATPSAAVASSFSKGAGETWLDPVGDGAAISVATNFSATIASHVSATAGDLIGVGIWTNDNTTLTVPTVTQTGLTLAAVVESPATALSSATSNDISADGCYRIATAGTSSAAAVVTGTNSVADIGIAWTTRLRVFTPETHSGTLTATGGGVASTSGQKGAQSASSATAGGVATFGATADHSAALTATASGVGTFALTSSRSSTLAATASGTASLSVQAARFGAWLLSGGGVLTSLQTTDHQTVIGATGGGSATFTGSGTSSEEHQGTLAATAGGVLTISASSGRQASLTATAGGLGTFSQTSDRPLVLAITGGGSAAFAGGSVPPEPETAAELDNVGISITTDTVHITVASIPSLGVETE